METFQVRWFKFKEQVQVFWLVACYVERDVVAIVLCLHNFRDNLGYRRLSISVRLKDPDINGWSDLTNA